MNAAPAAASNARPLPPLPDLRPDLALIAGSPSAEGEERWLIHDPLQQRFIQIGPVTYRLLQLWPQCTDAANLSKAMFSRYQIDVPPEDIATFAKFLNDNLLTSDTGPQGWRGLHAKGTAKKSVFSQVLHNYLFFRIPLMRPDGLLRATLPWVAPLYTRAALICVLLIGVAGLYLVSRQWDRFLHTFQHFFSVEGMLAFGAALVVVKIAHELGHAYTAVRYGCHVPTMGVALILLAPLPYTDVTDAWRLKDRRQRLAIDSAGMIVELAVAACATFLWAFLPDGPMRSVAFMLATVGWAMSLAINLNPFMKFDGYYLLSEATGVENLQPRAFTLGRWRLREFLFGLGDPCPETTMSAAKCSGLAIYAWAIWIYRLVLFLGIALFVYHYFFKLLGIALFLVEIVFFIAKPILNELKIWWSMRKRLLARPRTWLTLSATAALLVLATVPWSHSVSVPAILEVADTAQIYPPIAAIVEGIAVTQGQPVKAGQAIMTLASPELERQIEIAETELKLTRMRLARRTDDDIDREETLVLQDEQTALTSRIAGLRREEDRLVVRAPIDGQVLELNPGLHVGRWVSPKETIGLVGDATRASARGYLSEADLWRVTADTRGTFIPEMPTRPAAPVVVENISLAGVASIDLKELSSVYGGHLAATPDKQDRHQPASGQYLIRFSQVGSEPGPDRVVRGTVLLQGKAESYLSRIWRQVLSVGIRESGV